VVVSGLFFIVNYEERKFIFDKWVFSVLLYIKVCVSKTFDLSFELKNYRFNFLGAQRKSVFNLKVTDSNHGTYISFSYFDILIPK